MAPVLLGVVPFGLVTGVAATAAGIGLTEAVAMSALVFAGASQLAGIALVAAGAAPWLIWLTTLMINLRMLVYSASIAPHLRSLPRRERLGLAHLLTDQAYAFSILRYEAERSGERPGGRPPLRTPQRRRNYYLGIALPIVPVWLLATAAGALLGARVPAAWGVDFVIPLVFLAILAPALRDRPSWLAALVGGALALLLRELPANGGLIIGAIAGIAVGALAERWLERPQDQPA